MQSRNILHAVCIQRYIIHCQAQMFISIAAGTKFIQIQNEANDNAGITVMKKTMIMKSAKLLQSTLFL